MRFRFLSISLFVVGFLILGSLAAGISVLFTLQKQAESRIDERISALEQMVARVEDAGRAKELTPLTVLDSSTTSMQDQQKEIDALEKQIEDIQKQKSQVITAPAKPAPVALPLPEPDRLTAVVAKSAPAVVSIVVSKDVPQLEVVYQNPFGSDPFFQDFDIRVPVYRQRGTTKKKVGAGTGFLISRDGYIVTNRHVVSDESAEYMVLLSTGGQKKARVVYVDPNLDVALLNIDGSGYPTVPLGDSSNVKLGGSVIAIGNALGEYNNSVSRGIISGLDRTVKAAGPDGAVEELNGVIQTDAAINPGNSGGPLLTLEGKVIGVNVATVLGSNNISFAIPINRVRDIVRHYVPGV